MRCSWMLEPRKRRSSPTRLREERSREAIQLCIGAIPVGSIRCWVQRMKSRLLLTALLRYLNTKYIVFKVRTMVQSNLCYPQNSGIRRATHRNDFQLKTRNLTLQIKHIPSAPECFGRYKGVRMERNQHILRRHYWKSRTLIFCSRGRALYISERIREQHPVFQSREREGTRVGLPNCI